MATNVPASFLDENDVARLEGTLSFTGALPGGPPNGAAGGDLAGTYPNPTVHAASTPDSIAGNTDPITIETGSTAGSAFDTGAITIKTGDADAAIGGDGGGITIEAGDGDTGGGTGGSVTLKPGAGDTKGTVQLLDSGGFVMVNVHGSKAVDLLDGGGNKLFTAEATGIGFFGSGTAAVQTISGALSTVADAPAKAVLTSIIAALVAYGLAIDGTT